jgi:hypothetical protein
MPSLAVHDLKEERTFRYGEGYRVREREREREAENLRQPARASKK